LAINAKLIFLAKISVTATTKLNFFENRYI